MWLITSEQQLRVSGSGIVSLIVTHQHTLTRKQLSQNGKAYMLLNAYKQFNFSEITVSKHVYMQPAAYGP